jgi:hypothetical protein
VRFYSLIAVYATIRQQCGTQDVIVAPVGWGLVGRICLQGRECFQVVCVTGIM